MLLHQTSFVTQGLSALHPGPILIRVSAAYRCILLTQLDNAHGSMRVSIQFHTSQAYLMDVNGLSQVSQVAGWVPWLGEVTIAGATFSCAWSAFGVLVNG
ncbi:hypothetical protein AB6A68_13990 [Ferrimicrobium acidiphilum]|uniref:Uncharacterized protein n=2 Tax=Ferrimicrobium acidiphilum TaxID=121039 RepID=A0ABV3Y5T3_9ACTN